MSSPAAPCGFPAFFISSHFFTSLLESWKTALRSEEREEGIGLSFDLPTGLALRPQRGAAPEVSSGVNRNAIPRVEASRKFSCRMVGVGQGKLSLWDWKKYRAQPLAA